MGVNPVRTSFSMRTASEVLKMEPTLYRLRMLSRSTVTGRAGVSPMELRVARELAISSKVSFRMVFGGFALSRFAGDEAAFLGNGFS
jgi:hypothetical protein